MALKVCSNESQYNAIDHKSEIVATYVRMHTLFCYILTFLSSRYDVTRLKVIRFTMSRRKYIILSYKFATICSISSSSESKYEAKISNRCNQSCISCMLFVSNGFFHGFIPYFRYFLFKVLCIQQNLANARYKPTNIYDRNGIYS